LNKILKKIDGLFFSKPYILPPCNRPWILPLPVIGPAGLLKLIDKIHILFPVPVPSATLGKYASLFDESPAPVLNSYTTTKWLLQVGIQPINFIVNIPTG
jgi:hypothetical protein